MPTSTRTKKASAGRAMKPSGAATQSKTLLPYTYSTRSSGKEIRPEGSLKRKKDKKKPTTTKPKASKTSSFGAKKSPKSTTRKSTTTTKKSKRKVVPSKTKKPSTTTLVQPASLQGYRGVMVVSTMPQGGYPVGCGLGAHSIRL